MSDYSDMEDGYDSDEDVYMSDDDGVDFQVSEDKGKGKAADLGLEHSSFSGQKLQEIIDADIYGVSNVIGLEPQITAILLRHMHWDNEKLLEKFMDSPEDVLRSAGEPEPIGNEPVSATQFSCCICLDDYEPADQFSIRCRHVFCRSCWTFYITDKIRGEGQVDMKCMEQDCPTIVDAVTVASIVDEETLLRYKELIKNSYVSAHSNLRFCPHPGCDETISSTSVGLRSKSTFHNLVPTVFCGNSHSLCFGCGLDSDHRPVICHWVSRWLKNAKEDSGTAQWIKANTRECPKCARSIEKNGGCNRMVCGSCSYQFCWMCRQDWSVHGYSETVCSVWKEPTPDDTMTEATRTLEKWLFYYDRFNNHEMSAKLDQELCESTAEKMIEVQESSNLSWIESKFMQNAVQVLTKCRITLKWSYAMAFYLAQGNAKEIFEDLQANLEKAVEDLSQMLEESVEADTIKSLRQRMTDKTVYVQKRHEILLEDTARGLLEDRWEWKEPI